MMPRVRIAPVTFASEDLAVRKGRTCRPGAPTRTPDRCKVQETHSLVSVGGRQFARHRYTAARFNGPHAPGPSRSLRVPPFSSITNLGMRRPGPRELAPYLKG